jgi:hypothetical protein
VFEHPLPAMLKALPAKFILAAQRTQRERPLKFLGKKFEQLQLASKK